MSRTIESAVRTFKDNLLVLVDSRNFAITQELYTEIKAIMNVIDSVKLDNMFLATSNTWRGQFNEQTLKQDQNAFLSTLAQGDLMIKDLKVELSRKKLATLQENQIRNAHHVAKEKLRDFIRMIHPYTFGAYTRLENYGVNLGIRDRFTSIRNELSPINQQDPLKTYVSWADKTKPELPPFKTPDWKEHAYGLRHDHTTLESRASTTNKNYSGQYFPHTSKDATTTTIIELNSNNNSNDNGTNQTNKERIVSRTQSLRVAKSAYPTKLLPPSLSTNNNDDWKKHATEAGINLAFPGTTEQKYRYTKPVKIEYKNFIINPQQDHKLFDRPFTTAACYQHSTEYSSRYQYPDGNKIDKFPWIKQY